MLYKDLSEGDHISVIVKSLCEVDHGISRVLLITGTGCCQKSGSGSDSYRIALACTSRSGACRFPRSNRVDGGLSDPFGQRKRRGSDGCGSEGKDESVGELDHY